MAFYLLLSTSHAAYGMNKENEDEVNLGKRTTPEFLVPEIPAKYVKQEAPATGPASPAPVSPRIDSLTSPLSKVGLTSPVGLKTPKKYIDSTPTPKILDLFVTNFLHYEKQSPLTSLVKFLFSLDDNGKLKRNDSVVDHQRDPHLLFPKFLWAEINEGLFKSVFELYRKSCAMRDFHFSLRACKTPQDKKKLRNEISIQTTDQELLDEMLNAFNKKFQKINPETATKKEFLSKVDRILETKYRFKNCVNSCDQNLDQKRCNTCSQFKFSATQKKWLETLLTHLIVLENETDKELYNRYQTMAYYLLGFYLYGWNSVDQQSSTKIVIRKLDFNFKEENSLDQNSDSSSINKPFNLIAAAQERLTYHASRSHFHYLLPKIGSQMKQSNAQLIEDCIEASPLYYLLCFNIHHQEINERIKNICQGRYEPVNTVQNSIMLGELVRDLVDEYKNCLQVASCLSQEDSSLLTKMACARNILMQTFDQITHYLIRSHQQECFEDQLMLEADLNVCSYDFKDLILIALMIKNALSLDTCSFDNNIIVAKQNHIENIVYELHKLKQKYELGGGHMDRTLPYAVKVGADEHVVTEAHNLVFNPTTGVSFRDWFIYDQVGNYTSHKNATVFPACFNVEFWSRYVLRLLAQNSADRDVCCYDSGKRVKEQDGSWKRMIVFQHEHYVGCKSGNDCPCNQNSTMYVTAIIREEIIDITGDPNDQNNILRSLISLYPLAVYCLDYKDGNLLLNGEHIGSDDDLARLIPNYLDYKRMPNADQGLVYDQQGKPLYEEVALSYDALHVALFEASTKLTGKQKNKKTIAGNIDSSLIEITDHQSKEEYALVKVAQGIVVKILKNQLIKLSNIN